MEKDDPARGRDDGSQGPGDRFANPLVGCLAVWLSVLSCVAAVVLAYLGRWGLAGGAFVLAVVLWLIKGKVDPRLMAEFSELYGVDSKGEGDETKGPRE